MAMAGRSAPAGGRGAVRTLDLPSAPVGRLYGPADRAGGPVLKYHQQRPVGRMESRRVAVCAAGGPCFVKMAIKRWRINKKQKIIA